MQFTASYVFRVSLLLQLIVQCIMNSLSCCFGCIVCCKEFYIYIIGLRIVIYGNGIVVQKQKKVNKTKIFIREKCHANQIFKHLYLDFSCLNLKLHGASQFV